MSIDPMIIILLVVLIIIIIWRLWWEVREDEKECEDMDNIDEIMLLQTFRGLKKILDENKMDFVMSINNGDVTPGVFQEVSFTFRKTDSLGKPLYMRKIIPIDNLVYLTEEDIQELVMITVKELNESVRKQDEYIERGFRDIREMADQDGSN